MQLSGRISSDSEPPGLCCWVFLARLAHILYAKSSEAEAIQYVSASGTSTLTVGYTKCSACLPPRRLSNFLDSLLSSIYCAPRAWKPVSQSICPMCTPPFPCFVVCAHYVGLPTLRLRDLQIGPIILSFVPSSPP